MKPFLVDVPVKINIWIRPECQKKQFEVIKKARPSILFIQSDGGRNEIEWERIRTNRTMIDNGIDWECTVFKVYEDHNNGLYSMGEKMQSFIWSKVDRCILLEDDHIPTVGFFRFCAELLEKYKNDYRIECICGFNNLNTWEKCSSDYFFSRQGAIWGIATWKRVIKEFNDFSYGKDYYTMNLLRQRTRHNNSFWKRLNAYTNSSIYEGHPAADEFFFEFSMYAQNRLQIVPRKNMIKNIGIGTDSEHSDDLKQLPRGIRKVFNSEIYECSFPLNHPRYVIPDIEYEKKRNRVLAYNHPIVKFWRDMERFFYKLIAGDVKYIANKAKKRISSLRGERNEY